LAQGDLDAVRRTVRAGKKHTLGSDLYPGKRGWFAALEAQASLQEGDLAAAGHWATAAGLTPADTPHHWDELPFFVYVRLLVAQSRLDEADTILATLERSAQESGRLRKLITVYLQQALIQKALHHPQAAIACAERAVHLAAPEGYTRAFLDEGPGVAKLLPHIRHTAPNFVAHLLEAFRRETQRAEGLRAASVSPPTVHANALIEPLTEREMEILRFIAAGRSNPEIADLLYLSLNTVKWHVKNLYGKLQVSNRVEAAARADALGLLET
jgi:LuxR family maltose regulon positive regulatory protein